MEKTLTAESTPSLSTNELFFGSSPKKRLNQWLATGICGNDISSSCLYVSAIAAVVALTIFLFHMVTLTLGHHRLLLIKIYSSFSEILL